MIFFGLFNYHLGDRNFNQNHVGMVEQMICANAHTFVGTPLSTFTGYITRMRGINLLVSSLFLSFLFFVCSLSSFPFFSLLFSSLISFSFLSSSFFLFYWNFHEILNICLYISRCHIYLKNIMCFTFINCLHSSCIFLTAFLMISLKIS